MAPLHRKSDADTSGGNLDSVKRKQPRLISANSLVHDRFNLYSLPVLGLMAFLGIVGALDGMITTLFLTMYIVLDLAWIILVPDAVPALPGVIIFHHLVTLVLLAYPIRYSHFAIYSNWDGLVEINTFFLIARRQVCMKGGHIPCTASEGVAVAHEPAVLDYVLPNQICDSSLPRAAVLEGEAHTAK
eukprot:scaffold54076_cov44-Prasinocladus_malaysianus.AAC.1